MSDVKIARFLLHFFLFSEILKVIEYRVRYVFAADGSYMVRVKVGTKNTKLTRFKSKLGGLALSPFQVVTYTGPQNCNRFLAHNWVNHARTHAYHVCAATNDSQRNATRMCAAIYSLMMSPISALNSIAADPHIQIRVSQYGRWKKFCIPTF